MQHIAPGTAEKRPTRKENDWQGQHPRCPSQQLLQLCRQITWRGGVSRVGVHHDLHHAQTRHHQAPKCFSRLNQSAFTGKGIVGWQCPVASPLHGLHPARGGNYLRVPHHLGAMAACTNLHLVDTRNAFDRIFNRQRARCTVHAFDHEVGFPAIGHLHNWPTESGPLLRIVKELQCGQRVAPNARPIGNTLRPRGNILVVKNRKTK